MFKRKFPSPSPSPFCFSSFLSTLQLELSKASRVFLERIYIYTHLSINILGMYLVTNELKTKIYHRSIQQQSKKTKNKKTCISDWKFLNRTRLIKFSRFHTRRRKKKGILNLIFRFSSVQKRMFIILLINSFILFYFSFQKSS